MTDIILGLAALLLSLFCLVYSLRQRRELYSSQSKGPHAALKSRRKVYLVMLGVLTASAAALLEGLAPGLGAWPGAVSNALQIALLPAFALYAAMLLRRRQSEGAAQRGVRRTLLLLALTPPSA